MYPQAPVSNDCFSVGDGALAKHGIFRRVLLKVNHLGTVLKPHTQTPVQAPSLFSCLCPTVQATSASSFYHYGLGHSSRLLCSDGMRAPETLSPNETILSYTDSARHMAM